MHVSAETFSTTDALRIYNFPIIHPQYMLDLALRETETEPDFSRFWAKDAERALGDERLMAEIELADHVLVGSHFAKQTFVLQGFPDDAISVIPYGVDTRKFSPGPRNKRETPRCLFVGGINQRKGLSYLMHAARLARESVQFNLVLIGSGSLPQAMEEYDGEYEFLGTMSHRLLHREFKQADLFVFPTLAEGLGLVALEAMASGVPVLTSPYGPNEVVRDGVDGIVIEPRDTERMADAWVRVLLDDELRYRMAVSARERAESFSWRAYQTRLLQALHSMS